MSRSIIPISSHVDPIGYFVKLFDSTYLDSLENYFSSRMIFEEGNSDENDFDYENLKYTITKGGEAESHSFNEHMKNEWDEEFIKSRTFISTYINTSIAISSNIHSYILIKEIEFVNQMAGRLNSNSYSNLKSNINELKILIQKECKISADDNISSIFNAPIKIPNEKISPEDLPKLLNELFETESGGTDAQMFIANLDERKKAISTIYQLQGSSFDPQSLQKFNVNWRKEPTCYIIKKLAETTLLKIIYLSENQLCQIENTPIGNSNSIYKNASKFNNHPSQLKQNIDELFLKYLYS